MVTTIRPHYTVRCDQCGRVQLDGTPPCSEHRGDWRYVTAGMAAWGSYRGAFTPRDPTKDAAG